MSITKEQNSAAGELVELIALKIGDGNRAIHPETAISASARLAGSLLLRSFNLDPNVGEPGSVLLSEEANKQGPILVNILSGFLSASNIQIDKEKVGGNEKLRGEDPHLTTIESIALLQNEALNICKENSLNMQSSAQAAALATAFVVKECAPQIGTETAFNVAILGFIEGSKTIPPKIATKASSTNHKRPWYKIW